MYSYDCSQARRWGAGRGCAPDPCSAQLANPCECQGRPLRLRGIFMEWNLQEEKSVSRSSVNLSDVMHNQSSWPVVHGPKSKSMIHDFIRNETPNIPTLLVVQSGCWGQTTQTPTSFPQNGTAALNGLTLRWDDTCYAGRHLCQLIDNIPQYTETRSCSSKQYEYLLSFEYSVQIAAGWRDGLY